MRKSNIVKCSTLFSSPCVGGKWQVAGSKRRRRRQLRRGSTTSTTLGSLNGPWPSACSHEGGQTDRVKILELSPRFVCRETFFYQFQFRFRFADAFYERACSDSARCALHKQRPRKCILNFLPATNGERGSGAEHRVKSV